MEKRQAMCILTSKRGAFAKPNLTWQRNKYYIFRVRVCGHIYPTCKALAPCYTFVAGCPAVPYSYTLSHKRYDFRKKKLLITKRVFLFSLQALSETFLILRRTERDTIRNVLGSCDRASWNIGWTEINQQDATNPILIIKLLSQHVSGIIMPIIRRTRPCITAYGVLHLLCWLWLCGAGS